MNEGCMWNECTEVLQAFVQGSNLAETQQTRTGAVTGGGGVLVKRSVGGVYARE